MEKISAIPQWSAWWFAVAMSRKPTSKLKEINKAEAVSEWQDMQQKPNTKLRDLLKNKKAKTRKLSELSKIEQKRLAKLNTTLD